MCLQNLLSTCLSETVPFQHSTFQVRRSNAWFIFCFKNNILKNLLHVLVRIKKTLDGFLRMINFFKLKIVQMVTIYAINVVILENLLN